MTNKYKIIVVQDAIKNYQPYEMLERQVNEFLNNNSGFFPQGAPVYVGGDLLQVLVSVGLLDG